MLAFVLGGGGTKAAAQAGAMRALVERGIVPDMLVGTSAGAINAAQVAIRPTLEGIEQLENAWRALNAETIFSSGRRSAAWRTVRGRPSLYSSDRFRDFLVAYGSPLGTFATANKILYIVAAQLHNGRLYVFGDRSDEDVLDALIASTARPPIFPPVRHDDMWLVDGGVSANLPLRVAIQRGATEIYAFDISVQPQDLPNNLRVWNVTELSVSAMVRDQMRRELTWARLQPGVTVHHMPIPFRRSIGSWEMEAIEDFLHLGYRWAKAYLIRNALPQPERSFVRRVWQALGSLRRAANAVARGISSAGKVAFRLLRRRGNAHFVKENSIEGDSADDDGL